jgi:hypothetical protein
MTPAIIHRSSESEFIKSVFVVATGASVTAAQAGMLLINTTAKLSIIFFIFLHVFIIR